MQPRGGVTCDSGYYSVWPLLDCRLHFKKSGCIPLFYNCVKEQDNYTEF